ncbi:MAG: SDR family oxidoreductase [Prochloraceae cyanobacterium]|nr:SDR family oxidoreductase [Prochloraceae cyanobacterium]
MFDNNFDNNIDKHNSTFFGSVVISGASSGIGQACAIHLDKLGYQVFAGVRKEIDGQNLINKSSGRIIPIILDVTDETSIKKAIYRVKKILGSKGLTALINNAAIVIPGALEYIPVSKLRKQLEVNVIGLLSLTQACLPLLRKVSGRIINMGSQNGKFSPPFLGTYSASKFAVEALTDALRVELQPWGMHVSVVEPGAIKTPVWKKCTNDGLQIFNSFPKEVKQLYSLGFDVMYKAALESAETAIPCEIVAKTVEKILTAKKPKTRYVIGLDAKITILLSQIMPDRLFDKILTLYFGYPTTTKAQTTYEQQETSQKNKSLHRV